MRSILQSRRELRRATNASKIIIDERDARNKAKEAKDKIKTKVIKANTRVDARAIVTTTTTIIDKKQLLRLCE